MASVNWTREAERWLQEIYSYIADDNPNAAASVVDGIFDRVQVLEEFPQIGYRYQFSEREIRILLFGHYRIAYLTKSENQIDILGIFHGALKIEQYLV